MSDKKKKIIIIGPAYPYRGGNALFVSHTYDVLKVNFNVKIYNYKLLYPSIFFPGTTQIDESEKKVFNVPNERVINSISPFNWISVANRLKRENADLIIFDWWHPFFGLCHGVISYLIKKYYA
ncbi:MAG: glycosyl transferase family 1, partial [Ignavibacteria bacterium]